MVVPVFQKKKKLNMSLVTAEHVEEIVRAATARYNGTLNQKLDELTAQLNALKPPTIEPYKAVIIDPSIGSGNASLDLIKSLPEFDGNPANYPAWRAATKFAMEYYPENSEKYYVATGILRNKVTSSANATLSAFNTVLNFKAILARLDQTYSDKRPLHVLENELSILRQDNLNINEFYDKVDKQLTLIINKHIMSFHGQDELVAALSERARENALRVFISGLRRPLCDILFSAQPRDLPSALATAQELEINHRRSDFARAFATGNFTSRISRPKPFPINENKPIPMDVDKSQVIHRSMNPSHNIPFHRNRYQQKDNHMSNNFPQRNPQNYNTNNQYPNANTGAIPKRSRDISNSMQLPVHKHQRINHMPESNSNASNFSDSEDNQSEISDVIDVVSDDQLNFLE